ncbi:uncharacterized protein LOC107459395 [Arachis duranensis]|uniref:Uncharacterized protein LOC107459395 n=1 Tax=Arachis duranensis TaxID=130453 RepID=A0A6P4B328_ARADU|nr:uncharacterized protein LOC107459395 [Arachis duranensis]
MAKIWVEICLISARGVRGSTPSLWKRQWYAVGWVDPNNKYCTKIDSSGNSNPLWRTKFSFQVDTDSEACFQELALSVEVYSRDPIFLTEKLHGSTTVLLKEFLAKHVNEKKKSSEEEVGSYQLRGKKSNKPRGFVDVSVRVSEEKKEPIPHLGNDDGIVLQDHGNKPHLVTHGGFGQGYPQQPIPQSFNGSYKQEQTNAPYAQQVPFPSNYSNPYGVGPSYTASAGPSYYQPARGPPPPMPPPPSKVGYAPSFYPSSDGFGPSYINMPSSSSYAAAPNRPRGPPGFAIGAGAGALAAGAVMFGDDAMSRFDVSSSLGDPTIAIVTDPLF